jgi:hypothetical protein
VRNLTKKTDYHHMVSEIEGIEIGRKDKFRSLEMIQKYDGYERLRRCYPQVVDMVAQDKMVGFMQFLWVFNIL